MFVFPEIQKFSRSSDYFAEFLRLNKGHISHRSFAAEIGWPMSLIGDIIQGRKGLSIARALEFSRHFGLTGPEGERLVVFALADMNNQLIHDYVEGYLTKEGAAYPILGPEAPTQGNISYWAPENIADLALSSLKMFLDWCSGVTTPEEIGDLLYLSPELKDPAVLKKKLDILRELGFISGELPQVKVLKSNTSTSGMTRKQLFQTLEGLKALTEDNEVSDQRLTHWWVQRAGLPIRLYPELNQRLDALRNWVHNSCSTEEKYAGQSREETVLLQCNFFLTHLLDLKKVGLKIEQRENKFLIGALEDQDQMAAGASEQAPATDVSI